MISTLLVPAQTHAAAEPENNMSVVERCVISVPGDQAHDFHPVNDKTCEKLTQTYTEGWKI